MRAAGIVMVHPFSKRALQMRFTQRYHIIQTLSTDASDASFAEGIRRRGIEVITHRLEGGGSVTDCKSCFRPEAGKMSPAPSGLQAVDGLNHLHGSLRLGSRFD